MIVFETDTASVALTARLRWVIRYEERASRSGPVLAETRVLQQLKIVTKYKAGYPDRQREEWFDVPVEAEEDRSDTAQVFSTSEQPNMNESKRD